MISSTNFQTAVNILDGLTSVNTIYAQPILFGEEYK